jgi:hypothetical protein
MSNGAANDISPEMLASAAANPQFVQAFRAAWQQQQNAGAAPEHTQADLAFQPQQVAPNPFLQMLHPQQSVVPQNLMQQLLPQQGGINFLQMLPLFAVMAQAAQLQQLPQHRQQPAVVQIAPTDVRILARIDPSDVLDAELASCVRESRRNRSSLKLAVERMIDVRLPWLPLFYFSPCHIHIQTHGYTVAAWQDYFIERADAIFELADRDGDVRGSGELHHNLASANSNRLPVSAPPETTARQVAMQNLKRKWLGDGDLTDLPSSSEEDADAFIPTRPRVRASTSVPGRFAKRTAGVELAGSSAAIEPEAESNELSVTTRKPKAWTVRDVKMVAEAIVEIGEERWDAMSRDEKGRAVYAKVRYKVFGSSGLLTGRAV